MTAIYWYQCITMVDVLWQRPADRVLGVVANISLGHDQAKTQHQWYLLV